MAPKTKPAAKTTALAPFQERLAQYAKKTVATVAAVSGGTFVSLKGGILSVAGNAVPGNTLEVVVLGHVLENHYYTVAFDPDSPASPVCFAFGETAEDMKPHDASEEKQCDNCAACPKNQFGTAEKGKGKACGNIVRMALLTRADVEKDVSLAQPAFMKIPVTSVKEWAIYCKGLESSLGLPPFAVVTKLSVVPDAKSQFKVKFDTVATIDDAESIEALINRHESIQGELTTPYSRNAEEEAPAPRGAIKGSKAAAKGRGR